MDERIENIYTWKYEENYNPWKTEKGFQMVCYNFQRTN
jgi:hypothetical protein